jgi:hypothetical protein
MLVVLCEIVLIVEVDLFGSRDERMSSGGFDSSVANQRDLTYRSCLG